MTLLAIHTTSFIKCILCALYWTRYQRPQFKKTHIFFKFCIIFLLILRHFHKTQRSMDFQSHARSALFHDQPFSFGPMHIDFFSPCYINSTSTDALKIFLTCSCRFLNPNYLPPNWLRSYLFLKCILYLIGTSSNKLKKQHVSKKVLTFHLFNYSDFKCF